MPAMMRRCNRLALGAVVALAACGGDATSSEPTLELVRVEGNAQQLSPYRTVPVPPAVRVVRDGKPVAGVTVVFTVTSGGGSGGGTAVTDENGVARSGAWTLGGEIGEQRMVARLADDDRVTALFSAYAVENVAAQLFWSDRDRTFTSEVGASWTFNVVHIQVLALDGTPLPGETVRWGTNVPVASILGDSKTDAQGYAYLHYIEFGTQPSSSMRLIAQVLRENIIPQSAEWPIVLRAGAVQSITITAGANQAAPAGSTLPIGIRIQPFDRYGNEIKGFGAVTVIEGGGSVSAPLADSGTDWEWVVPAWTLGPNPGRNVLRVRVGAVDFDIEATGT